jgi:predicted alpha-1,2-mannosidase
MNTTCRKIGFLALAMSIGAYIPQSVLAVSLNQRSGNENPIVFVDPMIGTSAQGHTYPGATVPFGMVQLSPDNGRSGIDWYSGYHYRDTVIVGFSHTHLSGTNFGELNDILFMPSVGAVSFSEDVIDFPRRDLRSRFSHDNEGASPGYYRVLLADYNIDVELTATQRCGVHRYTFPRSDNSAVLIDLGFSINSDMAVETRLDVESDSVVSGYRFSTGYANDHRVYFVAKFSKPFKKFALGVGRTLGVGNRSLTGRNVKGVFRYSTSPSDPLIVKVGISCVSHEGALKNLEAEVRGWNFDAVREAAAAEWSKELNKIKIVTLDHVAKRIFYTALYHTMLAPVVDTDVDGKYFGADATIHTAAGYTHYSTFSLWDTFRAEHPLLTILHRERVGDMIQSLLAFAREAKKLPSWPLFGNETNGMGGYEIASVITDAYLKGIRTFNTDEAFSMLKQRATEHGTDLDQYMDQYINNGYVCGDKEIESVSKTLDFSFNDWCIAQLAKAFEAVDDYYGFLKRAGNYKNLYDRGTGFMRPKLSNGSWKDPFDPRFSVNRNDDYTAATAWQYTWFVPHDIQGLIGLMGGPEQFVERLDQLFEEDPIITGDDPSPEITGLIGLYAHGTEPSHHIPYLYCYAGAPWKTQSRVRQVLDSLYLDTPEGLCGNEGCGQLSAWYVFSAIGMYPVNPASGVYIIGSPYFENVSIETGGGKSFTITARNVSTSSKYIQSATINGNPLNRLYITHNETLQGAAVVFEMGETPNMTWGVNDVAVPPTDMK